MTPPDEQPSIAALPPSAEAAAGIPASAEAVSSPSPASPSPSGGAVKRQRSPAAAQQLPARAASPAATAMPVSVIEGDDESSKPAAAALEKALKEEDEREADQPEVSPKPSALRSSSLKS